MNALRQSFKSVRPGVWALLLIGLLVLLADRLWEHYAGEADAIQHARAPSKESPAEAEALADAAPAEPVWVHWGISSAYPPDPPDLFALRTWEPPPPPPPPPAPPPPPSPPPLPYRYMARINDIQTGSTIFVLGRDRDVIFAKVGDKLGAQYQLESYANGQLTFQYLPMKARQPIYIGQDS